MGRSSAIPYASSNRAAEAGGERGDVVGAHRRIGQRQREVVRLAAVADIGGAGDLERGARLVGELGAGLVGQLGERGLELRRIGAGEVDDPGLDDLHVQVGAHQPDGGRHAGGERHRDRADAEHLGEPDRVHRSRRRRRRRG